MPTYYIHSERSSEWFPIACNRPEGAVAPRTMGILQLVPGEGLHVTLSCFQKDPEAIYWNANDPVCQDSCMEAFIDCFPELPQYGYINLEINSNGAVLCGFGTDRYNRKFLTELGLPHPTATITKGVIDGMDYWQADSFLPLSLLETLYERPCNWSAGHKMKGNFYKIGSKTSSPHWCSWSPLLGVKKDFHSPEYFGDLIIG